MCWIITEVLKHPEDAKLAVEAGVDGIIVSNHGGKEFHKFLRIIILILA